MKPFAFLILFAIATRSAAEVNSHYMAMCRPDDEQCLRSALEQLRPKLLAGVPHMQLPPLDPLVLPDYIEINEYTPENAINMTVTEIQYSNTNFSVSKFLVDLDHPKLDLVLAFRRITLDMVETISAIVFGRHVNVTRRVKSILSKVVVTISLSGTKIWKDKELYVKWNDELPRVTLHEIHYVLDNKSREGFDIFLTKLFGTSELYEPISERFLKSTFGKAIVRVLNIVHDMFPVNQLYLTE